MEKNTNLNNPHEEWVKRKEEAGMRLAEYADKQPEIEELIELIRQGIILNQELGLYQETENEFYTNSTTTDLTQTEANFAIDKINSIQAEIDNVQKRKKEIVKTITERQAQENPQSAFKFGEDYAYGYITNRSGKILSWYKSIHSSKD